MSGTATAHSNAVICSPGNNSIHQYDILGTTYDQIVPHDSAGTYNMTWLQANGLTVMEWYRDLNNGIADDAQISSTAGAVNYVIWAIGKSNTFNGDTFPHMDSTNVVLLPCQMKLADNFVVNYQFIADDTVTYTVTLLGSQAW